MRRREGGRLGRKGEEAERDTARRRQGMTGARGGGGGGDTGRAQGRQRSERRSHSATGERATTAEAGAWRGYGGGRARVVPVRLERKKKERREKEERKGGKRKKRKEGKKRKKMIFLFLKNLGLNRLHPANHGWVGPARGTGVHAWVSTPARGSAWNDTT